MYEKLLDNAKKYDADVSACNYIIGKSLDLNQNDKETITVYSSEEIAEQFKDQETILNVLWGRIYKKELFNNIRIPDGTLHEDVWVTHRLLCDAKRVVYTDAKYYCYYEREDSTTTTQDRKKRITDLVNGMIDRNLKKKKKNNLDVQLAVARHTANLIIFFYRDCSRDIRKKEIRRNLRVKFREIMKVNNNVFSVKQIRYHAFRINPWMGILLTDIMSKNK